MKVAITTFAFVMALGTAGVCQCLPAGADQKTSWGNMNVVLRHPDPMRGPNGVVVIPYTKTPLQGVLVEVFDHPERVFNEKGEANSNRIQNRRAACLTSADGRFAFNLPTGRYEVRCSKAHGWDATSVLVEISKSRRAKRSGLKIALHVSQ